MCLCAINMYSTFDLFLIVSGLCGKVLVVEWLREGLDWRREGSGETLLLSTDT